MNTRHPIRVLIADDHALVRAGLAALVNAESDMQTIAEASDGCEAVTKFREHLPDVTLMDLRMPIVDGLEAARTIRQYKSDARILIVSTYPQDPALLDAMRHRVSGYLVKARVRAELAAAIRVVDDGGSYFPADSLSS